MKYIDIGVLLSKQFEKGEFSKYDIIIRYLFVKKYIVKGKGKNLAYGLYAKLARGNSTKNRKKSFIRLIKSFNENGYDENFPLEISKDYHICGGTHRIAICLYLNINKIPYIRKNTCRFKTRKFTKKWMMTHGFKEENISQIDKIKNKVFKRFGISG